MSQPLFSPPKIKFQCRQTSFDCPSKFTQIWLADDPLKSHFLNLFSVNTHATEAYVMRAMQQALPLIKNSTFWLMQKSLLNNRKTIIVSSAPRT
ncbi:metal-dependent hydrolase [Coxiella-like endosymbiont]|uniref:metal-dependent hydrolase n=1 Tax=Coxiella-like endosymbiont TaxID=1592897 RepID=UPI00272A3646|nr:metal-dependent hydrolase [Coxiella-like endosymbiont]